MATLLVQAERHLADNDMERWHKRALENIRKSGTNGISRTDLTRKLQFIEPKLRREILQSLVESGQTVAVQVRSGGRPALRYFVPDRAPGFFSNLNDTSSATDVA